MSHLGNGGVVVTDDRDVFRDPVSRLNQCIESSNGDEVVGPENSGRQLAMAQQTDAPSMPAASVKSPSTTSAFTTPSSSAACTKPARRARAPAPVPPSMWAIRRCRGRQGVQRRGELGGIVVGHGIYRRRPHNAADHDRWRGGGQGDDLIGWEPRADQHDAVDPMFHHRLNRFAFSRSTVPGAGEQQAKVVRFRRSGHPVEHFGKEGVVEIVQKHTDGAGAMTGQIAGGQVGPIPKFVRAAAAILSRVDSATRVLPFNASDTSARDTPACRATSSRVGRELDRIPQSLPHRLRAYERKCVNC